jgi:hypothetical protein
MGYGLKFGGEAGLFADFVSGDAVQDLVALYRDGFGAVGVDGMVGTFPQEIKAVGRQILNEITPFD